MRLPMRWKSSLELDLNLKYGFIKLKNMSSFIIEGGHRLKGNITPQGAKNEALQVICATLLTRERVTIENIPDILDVNNLIELLHDLGVEINKIESGVFTFKSENIDISYTETEEFRRKSASMRGSIMLAGPLLARFGEVVVPKPGGDKIGRRRLDIHFNSLMKLGADLTNDEKNQLIRLSATKLKGKYILLDERSEEHTSELQSRPHLVCRLLLEKKKKKKNI